jgi:hypothetical protein
MPRSTIAQRTGRIFDKFLELYSIDTAAISATTIGVPIVFHATKELCFDLAVNSKAYTGFVTTTSSWSISIEASTSLAGTYTKVGSIELDGTTKSRSLALSGAMISGVVPGATHLRVTATKVGAAGPLQFGAFLTEID